MKSLNPSPETIERLRLLKDWEQFKKDFFKCSFNEYLEAVGINPQTHFKNASNRFNRSLYYRSVARYGNNRDVNLEVSSFLKS